jgi:hypothetical protein
MASEAQVVANRRSVGESTGSRLTNYAKQTQFPVERVIANCFTQKEL